MDEDCGKELLIAPPPEGDGMSHATSKYRYARRFRTAGERRTMRYTEYHAGKAVIKDRKLLPGAMEKLAKLENMDKIPKICCEEYCKYPEQCRSQDEMNEICAGCKLASLFELLTE